MSNQIIINNYKELIQFIESSELSKEELSKLISQAFKVVVFDEDKTKEQLIQEIKTFIAQYKERGYVGIFLGLPSLDVKPNTPENN